MNLLKELEDERLSVFQKSRTLEEEILKITYLKDTNSRLTTQNETLSKENTRLVSENQSLREKQRENERITMENKEQLRIVTSAAHRDQEQLKIMDIQKKAWEEERNIFGRNIEELKGIIDELKVNRREEIKRSQMEISNYQEMIEKLQKEKLILIGKLETNLYIQGNNNEEKKERKIGEEIDFEVFIKIILIF